MIYSPDELARINDNPLYRTLGIEVLSCGEGSAVSVMAPRPEVSCAHSREATCAVSRNN